MSATASKQHGSLTVAIIGAGQAGRSLAAEAVRAGHRVVLEDVLPSRLRDALEEISVEGQPGTLEFATEVENAVRDADLAIDFVPDELESKLEIVSLLDRMAPPKTVFCIPTRVLSVDDLASCTYRADQFVSVEYSELTASVIGSSLCSHEAVELAVMFWRSVGRVTDVHGAEVRV
ncbi:3-hydroxyacyl-CoA dehydrogenase NAD-binding domain-containing protein [Terriglobus sp.]|uniref:3-hydroxyacyl-CoA dehydrogenase NAD-binding domain-containing protein n=1 Tax=Terriglobus sp. TaxID=1889013 RepID=UPI003AFFDD1F